MKKIAILAAMFGCFTFASADEVLQLKPVAVNYQESYRDSEAMFEVVIPNNGNNYQGVNFELYVPLGVEMDEADIVKGSALPFKSSKSGPVYDHTINLQKQATCPIPGYDMYKVMVYNTKNSYFLNGDLFSFYVAAPELAEGVYPVYMREVKMSTTGAAGSATEFPAITTYLKVGNGGASVVKAEGVVPETVSAALANETAISKLDLSAVTAINGDFTYADSRNVVAPADVTTSVKYEGNKPGYYSVNVPFAGDVTGKVYEFASAFGGYAHFDKVTTVEANKTYLAKGKVTIAANAKVVGVAEKTGQTGNYVLDDTFYHGSNLTVPATRGLFEGASLSNLRVVVDGELTGINMAQIEAGEAAYDLQGRQTTNTKNGVFVVNGKKQFVK